MIKLYSKDGMLVYEGTNPEYVNIAIKEYLGWNYRGGDISVSFFKLRP